MSIISQRLKYLRGKKGIKQENIASEINKTQQQYSEYELGKSELPLRALVMLADYYNVSADFIIGRIDNKEGIAELNKEITPDKTLGALIYDIQSLSKAGKIAAIEYIQLLCMKERCKCKH
jgi:transcriptional regulator with XRE-family HTH domain